MFRKKRMKNRLKRLQQLNKGKANEVIKELKVKRSRLNKETEHETAAIDNEILKLFFFI